jgi:hypothetical protein
MKKLKCPKKYRSIKNRIKIIVNISTFLTVLIMSIMILLIVNRIISEAGNATSGYYTDRIQDNYTRSIEINDNDMFQKEVEKIGGVVPIFSIRVVINNQVVFNRDAEDFYNNIQGSKIAKEQNVLPPIDSDNFKGIKVTRQLVDKNNNVIGEARVGIPSSIQLIIYVG